VREGEYRAQWTGRGRETGIHRHLQLLGPSGEPFRFRPVSLPIVVAALSFVACEVLYILDTKMLVAHNLSVSTNEQTWRHISALSFCALGAGNSTKARNT